MKRIIVWAMIAVFAWVGVGRGYAAADDTLPLPWIIEVACDEDCPAQVQDVLRVVRSTSRASHVVAVIPPARSDMLWLSGIDEDSIRRLRAFPSVLSARPATRVEGLTVAGTEYHIAGVVVDQQGAPVQQAWVYATDLRSGQVVADFSDASGAFDLVVPHAGDWLLTAQNFFNHGVADPVWVHVPPDVLDIRLLLRTGDHVVSGYVRDAQGQPVADVPVEAIARQCDRENIYKTNTDEDGRYEIALPAGIYEISAASVPRPPSRLIELRDQTPVTLNFQMPPAYQLGGQVRRSDGQPVADAVVLATPVSACHDLERWSDEATANDQGFYTLFLGEIPELIRAYWPEETGYGVVSTTVSLQRPITGADLQLPDLYPVSGTTLTAGGGSLSGDFLVEALTPAGDVVGRVTPEASGAFTFTLMSGRYTIQALVLGYPDPAPVMIEVTRPITGIELRSPPAFQIRGRVLDRAGQPVAGAVVIAQPAGSGEPESTPRSTDATGTYTLTVQAGVYEVRAVKDVPFPPRLITVTADITDVNFTYPITYQVRGLVKDEHGQPISTGSVFYLVQGLYPGNTYVQKRPIYYDGSFQFDLPAGTYEIEVDVCGYVRERRTVTGPPDVSLSFTLVPLSQKIQGRVTTLDGAPACAIPISAQAGDLLYETETATDWLQEVAPGTYALTVEPETYSVQPNASDYPLSVPEEARITVPPDADQVDFMVYRRLPQWHYFPLMPMAR